MTNPAFDPAFVLNAFVNVALAFSILPGVAFLVVSVTNLLKVILAMFKISFDNYSARVSAWLTVAAFGSLVYFRVFHPDLTLSYLDAHAQIVAQYLVNLTGFVTALLLPGPINNLLRDKLPLIGASYRTAPKASVLADMKKKPVIVPDESLPRAK